MAFLPFHPLWPGRAGAANELLDDEMRKSGRRVLAFGQAHGRSTAPTHETSGPVPGPKTGPVGDGMRRRFDLVFALLARVSPPARIRFPPLVLLARSPGL